MHEEKKLKIFTVTSYSLPESTAALAAQYSTDSIQQLIDNCERYRKEVWKLLEKQIKSTIKARTEQDESPEKTNGKNWSKFNIMVQEQTAIRRKGPKHVPRE